MASSVQAAYADPVVGQKVLAPPLSAPLFGVTEVVLMPGAEVKKSFRPPSVDGGPSLVIIFKMIPRRVEMPFAAVRSAVVLPLHPRR